MFVTGSYADGEQPGWRFLSLLPAIGVSVFFASKHLEKVKAHAVQLGEARKKWLDETRQFYSSPEWNQIRKEIIKEHGRVCTECNIYIRSNKDVTVDHIRPRSKYPHLALEKQNLRVLCKKCNSSKGASDSEISFQ